eukprot:CAMPEP_0202456860 /NCGR_PEP_ID=MMETSP1360-20130828/14024_1 /ASSEMBLY_ACC=CAM_ASM_000848 /TAXON_ID=515479 /ORGANISM="Licmophora paradoxa, Strain CCMP2313" /LENGTH=70 /DNA_ID=CAMNT_0049076801 /DNA_START=226 /DNA_END=438 /DNA_ORIENTATION=-
MESHLHLMAITVLVAEAMGTHMENLRRVDCFHPPFGMMAAKNFKAFEKRMEIKLTQPCQIPSDRQTCPPI